MSSNIIRWAAVVVTALFVLLNLGVTVDPDASAALRIGAGVMLVAGAFAAAGLARSAEWGRPAVAVVGALNAAGGVAALVADEPGGGIGVVLGGLAVVLAALAGRSQNAHVHA